MNGEVRVRARSVDDLPALCEALAGQQPTSRYPMRWPYPAPLETFIVRSSEIAAWVAEVDGVPVGHVSLTAVAPGDDFADDWARAHGCTIRELGCVSVLFAGVEAQGRGIGRRLLDTAVTAARERGLHPCLDVVEEHSRAREVYVAGGWQEVARGHMTWQTPDMPFVSAMVLRSAPAA